MRSMEHIMYITQIFIICSIPDQDKDHFQRLREAYPGSKLVIVSNTAGTDSDKQQKEAAPTALYQKAWMQRRSHGLLQSAP
jgi:hypothetical protein